MYKAIPTLLLFVLMAYPAASDTGMEVGRFTRTSPKGTQSSIDGIPLDSIKHRRSGREMRNGRYLKARPTEDISVGIVGCPGCTILLNSINGIYFHHGDR